jgi:hypothetical protein
MVTRYVAHHLQNLNEIVPMMQGAGSRLRIETLFKAHVPVKSE